MMRHLITDKVNKHYEPVMVMIVGSIFFLLLTLVGINLLLYISVPEHIGPNEAYIQLDKRVDEIATQATDHYSKDYYTECKELWYILEKRLRYVEVINGIITPGAGSAKSDSRNKQ